MRVTHLFCAAALASVATASAAPAGTNFLIAISKCQVDVTRQLLDAGADANATDAGGQPILRWFASGGSGCSDATALELANVLDAHGARFDRASGKSGPSVLTNLAPRRMPRTLAFLASKRAGDPSDALRAIASRDDFESVRSLLDAGADPTEGAAMRSPLMDAALAGRTESVSAMMTYVKDKQSPKVLAAYEAARRGGHGPTADAFIRAGVTPPRTVARSTACDPRGLTAEESKLLAQLGIVDQFKSCKFIQECGDEILIDCNSAADGPAYYIDRRAATVLATCGGACMRGCTGCPPKAWTCECHR